MIVSIGAKGWTHILGPPKIIGITLQSGLLLHQCEGWPRVPPGSRVKTKWVWKWDITVLCPHSYLSSWVMGMGQGMESPFHWQKVQLNTNHKSQELCQIRPPCIPKTECPMLKLLSQRNKGHRLQSLPENSRCIIVTDQRLLPWAVHHSELRFLHNDELSLVTAKLAKTGDLNAQMTTRDQNISFSGEKESLKGQSKWRAVTGKQVNPYLALCILWVPWASGADRPAQSLALLSSPQRPKETGSNTRLLMVSCSLVLSNAA